MTLFKFKNTTLYIITSFTRYAKYGMLIWYEHPEHGGPGCERMWKWGSSIDLIAKGEAEFFQFYQITRKYQHWYFCNVGDVLQEAAIHVGVVPTMNPHA